MRSELERVIAAIILIAVLSLTAVAAQDTSHMHMAVFVFNASLPMMQFTVDGTNFHTQV